MKQTSVPLALVREPLLITFEDGFGNKIQARKQRCLVHLLRLAHKWQSYFHEDRKLKGYFSKLKGLVKEILQLSERMLQRKPENFIDLKSDLIARLRRMSNSQLHHPKAERFREKLLSRIKELLACLDFKKVRAHNNWAEHLLRDNVIMRKITFGNRSSQGIRNHEVLMSLIQTARFHNLNPLQTPSPPTAKGC